MTRADFILSDESTDPLATPAVSSPAAGRGQENRLFRLRLDAFGWANHLGLLAGVLLLLL